MERLMDEFSELLGKKESDPMAKFHRKNDGFSKTQGNVMNGIGLGRVGKSDTFARGLKSKTAKKNPISSDPNNEIPTNKTKKKKSKKTTPETEYELLNRLPDMANNGRKKKKKLI